MVVQIHSADRKITFCPLTTEVSKLPIDLPLHSWKLYELVFNYAAEWNRGESEGVQGVHSNF